VNAAGSEAAIVKLDLAVRKRTFRFAKRVVKSAYGRTRGAGERRGLFRLDVEAEKTNRGSRFSLENARGFCLPVLHRTATAHMDNIFLKLA
jgi:hypothetical protein